MSMPILVEECIPAPRGNMRLLVGKPSRPQAGRPVLLLMEAFGVTPWMRTMASRFAAAGHPVYLPDLYYPAWPDNTFSMETLDAAVGMMRALTPDVFAADLDVLLAHMAAAGHPVPALVGYCMGGQLAVVGAALGGRRIGQAISFYGGATSTRLPGLPVPECPVHLVYGEADALIPSAEIQAVTRWLEQQGAPYTCDIIPGAGHGFCCEERPTYLPEEAGRAWSKMQDWLAQ